MMVKFLHDLGEKTIKIRGVFSLEAKMNSSHTPLSQYSLALSKNNKRLLFYHYNNEQLFEFYDLYQDPNELININTDNNDSKKMKEELLKKVTENSFR